MRLQGRLQIETVGSVVLKQNPLGDSHVREVPVYLPAAYFLDKLRRFPVVYDLPGFGGTGLSALNVHLWRENIVQRLDRLIASGGAPPCILVIPDCATRYGGSQYLNSAGTGRYEDHVVQELVPYIDAKFRTLDSRGRAVMGGSSGGFGALSLAMRHPDVFPHAACHSGDMGFKVCYGLDVPKCVDALRAYRGGFKAFLRRFEAERERSLFPHELVNMAGMASCYSPNPRGELGFDLPFDEETGEDVPAVWRRWEAFDPIFAARRHARALKALKSLYFDCGRRDQFHLHLGARRLARELGRLGVAHVYEEYDGDHFGLGPRAERSLKRLGRLLKR